jgi:hypothetical protein
MSHPPTQPATSACHAAAGAPGGVCTLNPRSSCRRPKPRPKPPSGTHTHMRMHARSSAYVQARVDACTCGCSRRTQTHKCPRSPPNTHPNVRAHTEQCARNFQKSATGTQYCLHGGMRGLGASAGTGCGYECGVGIGVGVGVHARVFIWLPARNLRRFTFRV